MRYSLLLVMLQQLIIKEEEIVANKHTTLTSLFDDIADAIRVVTPITAQIVADAFPAYIRMVDYTDTIPTDPSNLNSCSWDFIRWASDEGIADLIWSVGDRKSVSIGDWGNSQTRYQINGGTFYCYILGFNHNAALEGDNLTHFEFGFTATSGGVHIAFTGGDYGLNYTNPTSYGYPVMNHTATNVGGWKDSVMRNHTLSDTTNRCFESVIPNDLKSAVKTVTKYTDNVGGGTGSVEANVTATTDRFFLLNVNELRGEGACNTYEFDKTEQYQYYKNGNSKDKYRSDFTDIKCIYSLRSPRPDNSTQFIGLHTSGSGSYGNANSCFGVSPAFCV